MVNNHFLWPVAQSAGVLKGIARPATVHAVEELLSDMFPGHPVLCSSGRACLALALIAMGITRPDLVEVFPYASHCVIDTIARHGTPVPAPSTKTPSSRLVYHQWGYVQQKNLSSNTIEDCVDTLCVPGTSLFPGGSNFEVWSLTKILGTSSGGVLWCRDEDTAIKLRSERDARTGGIGLWMLRMLGDKSQTAYLAWQGVEGARGNLSCFQAGEIYQAISSWMTIVENRIKKLEFIWPYAPTWLHKPEKRLPTVVPVEAEFIEELIRSLGISSGYRMFPDFSGDHMVLKKVLPIPVHQNVDSNWLQGLLDATDLSNVLKT